MENGHRILKIERVLSGEWLHIDRMLVSDPHGHERVWETAGRNKARGAVAIVAILKPSGRVVLVSQYRPPAQADVLEFPAGLIDRIEELETTALRELHEETGYRGRIVRVLPASYSSPGMSGEAIHIALAEVDETLPENQSPQPAPDEGEFIRTILVPLAELPDFLVESQSRGEKVDAKLASFSLALSLQTP